MSYVRHFGYNLGWIGNVEGYYAGAPYLYEDTGEHWEDLFYLQGVWLVHPRELMHGRTTNTYTDYIEFRFTARRLSLKMRPQEAQSCRVRVMLDGKPVKPVARGCDVYPEKDGHTYVYVDAFRMYSLLELEDTSTHDFRLFSNTPALSLATCCITE
jgi:hypothetical protein